MGKRSFALWAAPLAIIMLLGIVGVFGAGVAEAHPLPGSIKTTDLAGNRVQLNHFDSKCEVALNGGAQQQQAHQLLDGFYDVAVTNPNGRLLLGVGEGTVEVRNGEGTFGPVSLCGLVRPSPYLTTDSNGGVYKVWLCMPDHLEVVDGQLDTDNNGCEFSTFKVTEDAPPVVPPKAPPTLGPPLPPGIAGPPGAPTPTPAVIVPNKLPESGAVATESEFWMDVGQILPMLLATFGLIAGGVGILSRRLH